MMGRLKHEQGQLFYSFCLDDAVPDDHLVREITATRSLLGACRARARGLCREVQVNLAYRWFCGLGIENRVPDHSTFTRARNERFRDGDIFRRMFERVVAKCIAAGLVGGKGFAVDASLIVADANKCRSTPGDNHLRGPFD
jgi:hypothetical protein